MRGEEEKRREKKGEQRRRERRKEERDDHRKEKKKKEEKGKKTRRKKNTGRLRALTAVHIMNDFSSIQPQKLWHRGVCFLEQNIDTSK